MSLPPDAPLVHARGLTRVYPVGVGEVVGVVDVDLTIPRGHLVVLKGNSGSGKSTLLALLGGLDRPTRGELVVSGRHLQKATPPELTQYRREVVGMVFQSFNLLPTLTVMENVCLPALMAGKTADAVQKQAMKWLDWLRLTPRVNHYPGQLSGGEMQRTAVVRALINDPHLILADEPTGNLDSTNSESVVQLLADLNRQFGRTVIIATHSSLADSYATLHLHLKDGRLVEVKNGSPAETQRRRGEGPIA